MRGGMSKVYYLVVGLFFVANLSAFCQNQQLADSLAAIYQKNTLEGTARLDLLRKLAFNEVKDLARALRYAEELIRLARQAGNYPSLHSGYLQKGNKKRLLGNLDEALEAYIKSAEAAKKTAYSLGEGTAYMAIADLYSISGNHANAMTYYDKAIAILKNADNSVLLGSAFLNAGDEYLSHKNYKSALLYFSESGKIFDKANYKIGKAYNLGNIGMVYANTGKNELAEKNINEAIQLLEELKDVYPISVYLLSMADIYLDKGHQSVALTYAQRSLTLAQRYGLKQQISDANLKLSKIYETAGDSGRSLAYYKRHIVYRDSVNNVKSIQKMADLRTDYEIAQKQVEVDLLNQEKKNQRIILISLFIILGLGAIILVTLYRYNNALKQQKAEIDRKSSQLETSLTDLRTTQTQLVQREKMASLGELTAGIAHEIQNPLNFVTNFSDLSTDLLDELKEEALANRTDDVLAIANDLSLNLAKIAHHGGRASAIVRGMLEHSRSSTGEQRPTDLNALANEYLKIAYHGLLVKDNDFACELVKEFDPDLPQLSIVPQEIGRVLLNLYTNAFYAVQQQRRALQAKPSGELTPYQCILTIKSMRINGYVQLRVGDNGTGIPEPIRAKIFQPFFTTKPTGEGTGLGLSLSYDIITKGHGGDLMVNSQEGKGSEFIIQLPITTPGTQS